MTDLAEKTKTVGERVVFLDWLRIIACFMVMVIHSCEPFYLGGAAPNVTFIANRWDAFWVSLVESVCRVCVPLFVMASSYLLFPLKRPAGEFFRRRLGRIVVPFLVWSCAYIGWFGDSWGKACFNFPDAGGHLWFVPMLLGLYLLMPLLSPWAERVRERELRGWLILWLFTTLFPYLRRVWSALYGAPSFGAVPYLYGECPWNMFGMFHPVSGFVGYLLLGFWFRRFAPELSWRRTLAVAVPLWLAGAAIIGGGFYFRIPEFPCSRPYAFAVDLEMSIEYCSFGVAITVIAAFLLIRKIKADGAFYRRVVRPLAEASYGTYLLHMFVLLPMFAALHAGCGTPVTIFATAAATYALASAAGVLLRRVPFVGRFIVG
ncbi:MAG: acyltransferase [Kiritimatiellae bacterium]|nr:acyltransferase [Kiritimatiellia bacterium]